MIILITGPSHTGKTVLAQKILEKKHYSYLSLDHLKMGLIRSGNTRLTPLSPDSDLTAYLWPIVREMIKTAIENSQNLIVEGCYIPFNWADDFEESYRKHIQYFGLVMSEGYIRSHFGDILAYANAVEKRLCDETTLSGILEDNADFLEKAQAQGVNYVLIDENYVADIHRQIPLL